MDLEAVAAAGRARSLPDVVVVQLDGIGERASSLLDDAIAAITSHPGLSVGVAADRLAGPAREVAQSLTVTVAASALSGVITDPREVLGSDSMMGSRSVAASDTGDRGERNE